MGRSSRKIASLLGINSEILSPLVRCGGYARNDRSSRVVVALSSRVPRRNHVSTFRFAADRGRQLFHDERLRSARIYPLVKRGTYVQEGMKLGFGKTIFEARAPVSGVVLHINAVPSLKKGDNIANIGAVATRAP
jgi:hypothetical protein